MNLSEIVPDVYRGSPTYAVFTTAVFGLCTCKLGIFALSLVLLLISNLTNGLCLHQFLVTKSAEANKSVKIIVV